MPWSNQGGGPWGSGGGGKGPWGSGQQPSGGGSNPPDLEELLRHLKPSARIAWSPIANLHVTTKFIGEWPEERLGELTAATVRHFFAHCFEPGFASAHFGFWAAV